MNAVKNEQTVKLGAEEILLRPTFGNLAALETNVGSISYLGWKYGRVFMPRKEISIEEKIKSIPPLTEAAQIIYYCQASVDPNDENKKKFSKEEIWELLRDSKGVKVFEDVALFLSRAGAGGEKKEEEKPQGEDELKK